MKRVLFLLFLTSLCHASDDWSKGIANFCKELGDNPPMWNSMSEGMPVSVEFLQKNCSDIVKLGAQSGPSGLAIGVVVVAIPTLGICTYHAGKAMGIHHLGSYIKNLFPYQQKVDLTTIQELQQDFVVIQKNELPAQVKIIATARLHMLAQSEESSVGDKCTFWREKYSERLKEEEDADRKAAISQGTLDEDY
jgi:hypothetical protein